MHKHLEALVHPHVEVDVSICSACITVFEATYFQGKRLLVEPALVQIGRVNLLVDAGRNHIRHRGSHPVLLQVDCGQGELRPGGIVHFHFLESGQILLVPPPLPTDQFQPGKTQGHGLAKILHDHPHETDGTEVADAIERLVVLLDGDLELVPLDRTLLSSAIRLRNRFQNVGQVALANVVRRQVSRRQRNLILVIRFDGSKGQVLIDVLRVGDGRRRDRVTKRLLGVGVPFVAAEELIAFQNVLALCLGPWVPEVPEVIGRRVRLVLCKSILGQFRFQPIQPRGKEGALSGGIQAIEAHILAAVVVGAVVKGIDHVERGGVGVNAPCAGVGLQLRVVGRRQPILKFELAVVEHVFADVAQVDQKLAP